MQSQESGFGFIFVVFFFYIAPKASSQKCKTVWPGSNCRLSKTNFFGFKSQLKASVCSLRVTFTVQKHTLEAMHCLQACVCMPVCVLWTGDLYEVCIPASHLATAGISDELAMKKKKNICHKCVTNKLNNNTVVMM